MEEIRTTADLMEQFANLNRENSVCQVYIPGKGKFTIVLQEEDNESIAADIKANTNLKRMMDDSMEDYKDGRVLSTSQLIKSLSPKDFTK